MKKLVHLTNFIGYYPYCSKEITGTVKRLYSLFRKMGFGSIPETIREGELMPGEVSDQSEIFTTGHRCQGIGKKTILIAIFRKNKFANLNGAVTP